jgi:large subunit ribosomal protein L25
MSRPKLSAQPRSVQGKAVKHLRGDGVLPAVVYGRGHDSTMIQLDAHEFELLRRRTGRNTLVDLSLDGGKATPVLLQTVQEHPVTRRPLHADFLVVAMTEEMTVDVAVAMVGSSSAIDRMGGVLLHLRESVQVRALPDNLPSSLELDITSLESFDDVLHVSDLSVPEGVRRPLRARPRRVPRAAPRLAAPRPRTETRARALRADSPRAGRLLFSRREVTARKRCGYRA